MNCATEMVSGALIYVPSFIKIGLAIQKLKGDISLSLSHTHARARARSHSRTRTHPLTAIFFCDVSPANHRNSFVKTKQSQTLEVFYVCVYVYIYI
jgi:hypothetical protein